LLGITALRLLRLGLEAFSSCQLLRWTSWLSLVVQVVATVPLAATQVAAALAVTEQAQELAEVGQAQKVRLDLQLQ
jgi:hypothetical protein